MFRFLPVLLISLLCQAETVTIMTGEYQPYTSTHAGGARIMQDLVTRAFAQENITVSYQYAPWKRCEAEVETGRAFAAIPYFKTEERSQRFEFSDPVIYSINRFFYNRERFPSGFEWQHLEEFRPYTFGGVQGYWYIRTLEAAGISVDPIQSDIQNMRKLVHQRIDFTIIDELTGKHLLQLFPTSEADKISMLEKPESIQPFHLLISRQYPNAEQLTHRFNRGLEKLKQSGEYRRTFEQYHFPAQQIIDKDYCRHCE